MRTISGGLGASNSVGKVRRCLGGCIYQLHQHHRLVGARTPPRLPCFPCTPIPTFTATGRWPCQSPDTHSFVLDTRSMRLSMTEQVPKKIQLTTLTIPLASTLHSSSCGKTQSLGLSRANGYISHCKSSSCKSSPHCTLADY
jgi:hypothetical protein